MLADDRVRRFHAEAALALAASGRLRAHRLLVGGRAAAVLHGFEDRGRVYHYLGGFDPALRAASPGAVLLMHVVEDAIRGGAHELDLLRARERYKYEWGAVDRPARAPPRARAARGAVAAAAARGLIERRKTGRRA